MSKKLVIVESPAKARTLSKILGKGYSLKASLGHVRDLPRGQMGVDLENGFLPKYVVPRAKTKLVNDLKRAVKDAEEIYLATDPDREGEAIAWHLAKVIETDKKPYHRVVFREITDEAVKDAFKNPRDIDMKLVDAQQARRVLDRLVGYKISPLLWQKVRKRLSAGRVQSVAVKIIVDREKEIQQVLSLRATQCILIEYGFRIIHAESFMLSPIPFAGLDVMERMLRRMHLDQLFLSQVVCAQRAPAY